MKPYIEDDIFNAITAIKNRASIKAIASEFSILRTTLRDRIQGL